MPGILGGGAPLAAQPAVDFNREIRPILSRHCFKCHGPDEGQRQGGLRLDLREAALQPGTGGRRAIVPGKPASSELVRRVFAAIPARRMPPAHANKPLTAGQKDVLERWIAAGAPYAQHWAFVAPRRPRVPAVRRKDWVRNPIDAFVLARLERDGLKPSPEADPYTLVRRVTLDLTGLAPTPEEADAFVRESEAESRATGPHPPAPSPAGRGGAPGSSARRLPLSPRGRGPGGAVPAARPSSAPSAYDRLVDRLLASPHYGERWARRWLDLARYADTNGYEKDRPRSIWPYRDWVINALNADMPFDQFTVQQLAGDMLGEDRLEIGDRRLAQPGSPSPISDRQSPISSMVATGFHRNTMLNEEGGIDPLEFRFHALTDRVAVTGTTWLGLTVGCAQCHTHKFDPITQREYYQLFAFLNNADEPEIEVPDPAVTARRRDAEAKIAVLEAALSDRFPASEGLSPRQQLDRQFRAWLAREEGRAARWVTLHPLAAKSDVPRLTLLDDASVVASGDQTKRDVYALTYRTDVKEIRALRLEALPDERLPKRGPGRTYYEGPHGDFFLSEVTLSAAGQPLKLAAASHSFASGKHTAAAAIDGDPQTGWAINGGQGQAHAAVFTLAEPLAGGRELSLRLLFERYHAAGLGRFRVAVTDAPSPSAGLPALVEDALAVPGAERTDAQQALLLRHFLSVAPELAAARGEIEALRDALPPLPTTLVMAERPPDHPRVTTIHHRGEFLQPGEVVQPGLPAVLPPLPPGALPDRLAFARWLVDRRNPLTARVTVNRQWAAFFGRGLVRTLDDFGTQGELPSRPELLDWLAVVFQSGDGLAGEYGSGGVGRYGCGRTGPASSHSPTPIPPHSHTARPWSLKSLHRLIVTSATYRQSSRVTPEGLRRDPENRLLARGARFRVEAELVRDTVLRASGLLSPKIGGPSVFPPQPPGVTSEGTYGPLEWKVSQGEDRYRRGLYTFAKRTAPYAMFASFDAPSGEQCLARREVSNTPLQALTLLNDAVILEAAQALGRATAARPGEARDRASDLFRRCLTRPPDEAELALLTRFYETQRERFARQELDPVAVAGAGDGDATERAAWTAVARALLNLDEAITRH